MARIEKTVFISYRRTDVYTALAVYENLKNQGYDVFFDYRSISSGDFEQVITSNVRARAHFLLILTPTALDRCNEPGDWLRREIELAIDEKRNIVPLFFKGFRFGGSSKSGISKWIPFGKPDVLTGKLANLPRYNGLNVHEDYFDEAMTRVRTEFLSKPLETVLHPVSTEVQKVVEEEQHAADEAIKQKEDKKEPEKPIEEKPDKQAELEDLKSQAIRLELKGDFWDALQIYYKIKKIDPTFPRVDVKIQELEEELKPKPVAPEVTRSAPASPTSRKAFEWQSMAKVAGIVSLLLLFIWGGSSLLNNSTAVSTQVVQSTMTATLEPVSTSLPAKVSTPSPTITSIPPTPTLGIGSTMTGSDGMTLLYVPAGEFTMGSEDGGDDEKPIRTVDLDAFWIDQTEVTNAMFADFVNETGHTTDAEKAGKSWVYQDGDWNQVEGADWMHPFGPSSGISDVMSHPVIHVSWNDAQAYCSWADRRLPTEAEWEKAARGADGNVYPWGDTFDGERLNFCDSNCSFSWADENVDDGYEFTAPVGTYPNGASPYGALDMAGNVWEWAADWYDAYPGNTTDNSSYGETYRVLRGGSWSSSYYLVRSAVRFRYYPTYAISYLGFRCASSP